MMLKLTGKEDETIILIDTTGAIFHQTNEDTFYTTLEATRSVVIKETIEEIIQQIKEGGITNVN